MYLRRETATVSHKKRFLLQLKAYKTSFNRKCLYTFFRFFFVTKNIFSIIIKKPHNSCAKKYQQHFVNFFEEFLFFFFWVKLVWIILREKARMLLSKNKRRCHERDYGILIFFSSKKNFLASKLETFSRERENGLFLYLKLPPCFDLKKLGNTVCVKSPTANYVYECTVQNI